MPPAIARSFSKCSSSLRAAKFAWNKTAVAMQKRQSSSAAARVSEPAATARPAPSWSRMVAAARAAGTPSLAIVAKVPSRFDARTRPSWMKIQASRSRASSSRPSVHGCRDGRKRPGHGGVLDGWEGEARAAIDPTPRASAARLGGDRLLEVRTFLAAARTELSERRELVPGLVHAPVSTYIRRGIRVPPLVRLQFERLGVVG